MDENKDHVDGVGATFFIAFHCFFLHKTTMRTGTQMHHSKVHYEKI
jgi:hypothetical protein